MALSTTLRNKQVRQLGFFDEEKEKKKPQKGAGFNDPAFGNNKTLPIHRWVPWIAGFSQTFVRDAILRYMPSQGTVLDPFSGVGTTLVEAMLLGHEAIGFEINPYAALATEGSAEQRWSMLTCLIIRGKTQQVSKTCRVWVELTPTF